MEGGSAMLVRASAAAVIISQFRSCFAPDRARQRSFGKIGLAKAEKINGRKRRLLWSLSALPSQTDRKGAGRTLALFPPE